MTEENYELVIVTGMSGAGKTVAMQSFEDMGYFCVDNMPPKLIPKFWDLISESESIKKVALVIDLRSQEFYSDLISVLDSIENRNNIQIKLLFLEASDEELVARYKETRRMHPLASDSRPLDGIKKERRLLSEVKSHAQLVIDTTSISPRQLREEIFNKFQDNGKEVFHVEVMSFGFKYGMPIDADIVMDVRFLPNPYYVKELRNKDGRNEEVYDYVMRSDLTEEFYTKFKSTLDTVIPGYIKEGKLSTVIAIGCTGGQHRSVAIAERLAKDLKKDYPVMVAHRDVDKRKETVNRS